MLRSAAIQLILLVLIISACKGTDNMPDRKFKSKNFNGKEFINPVPTDVMQPGGTWETMKLWFRDTEKRNPKIKPGPFKADLSLLNAKSTEALRVTWLGHSTVLIEIDGKRFITDPVFSRYSSPVSFYGVERFFDVPLEIKDLPKLDGVIISHDHYDHLDKKSIQQLGRSDIKFYCPIGIKEILSGWGINKENIIELDWWENISPDNKFTITSAPARHFSGRGIFRNNTQWASWIIKGPKHKVYFGGDSGLWDGYKEIGDKYGPFDLTILEIGAYHKYWGNIHLGPDNALEAHKSLKGKILLPIHWGTFNLGLHAWTEPAERIINLAQGKNISLLLPAPGQTRPMPNSSYISKWWEPYK